MDTIRKLFNSHKTVTDERTGKTMEQTFNILEHFDASNTEGVDPTNTRIFETVHPHPLSDYKHSEVIKVPRAIGYLVEVDPRSRIAGPTCSLQVKGQEYTQFLNDDFGTLFDFHGRVDRATRNNAFFVYGQTLVIDFSVQGRSRRGPEQDDANAMMTRWGIRLSVKPLLGTPSYRSKPSLKTDVLKPIFQRIGGDLGLYSWF